MIDVMEHKGLIGLVIKNHFARVPRWRISTDDMWQEGYIGLIGARDRYRGDRGAAFGTYAYYWIRARIARFVARNYSVIRLPNDWRSNVTKRSPKIREAILRAMRCYSASQMGVCHDRRRQDNDLWGADDPVDLDTLVDMALIHDAVRRGTTTMTDQQRRAFALRAEGMTLQDVGDIMGLSRERIRQLESVAIRKCRSYLHKEQVRAQAQTEDQAGEAAA